MENDKNITKQVYLFVSLSLFLGSFNRSLIYLERNRSLSNLFAHLVHIVLPIRSRFVNIKFNFYLIYMKMFGETTVTTARNKRQMSISIANKTTNKANNRPNVEPINLCVRLSRICLHFFCFFSFRVNSEDRVVESSRVWFRFFGHFVVVCTHSTAEGNHFPWIPQIGFGFNGLYVC